MKKFKLLIDLKKYKLKKGVIFEWFEEEDAYLTRSLPWFLSPLISKGEMRLAVKKRIFKELKSEDKE